MSDRHHKEHKKAKRDSMVALNKTMEKIITRLGGPGSGGGSQVFTPRTMPPGSAPGSATGSAASGKGGKNARTSQRYLTATPLATPVVVHQQQQQQQHSTVADVTTVNSKMAAVAPHSGISQDIKAVKELMRDIRAGQEGSPNDSAEAVAATASGSSGAVSTAPLNGGSSSGSTAASASSDGAPSDGTALHIFTPTNGNGGSGGRRGGPLGDGVHLDNPPPGKSAGGGNMRRVMPAASQLMESGGASGRDVLTSPSGRQRKREAKKAPRSACFRAWQWWMSLRAHIGKAWADAEIHRKVDLILTILAMVVYVLGCVAIFYWPSERNRALTEHMLRQVEH